MESISAGLGITSPRRELGLMAPFTELFVPFPSLGRRPRLSLTDRRSHTTAGFSPCLLFTATKEVGMNVEMINDASDDISAVNPRRGPGGYSARREEQICQKSSNTKRREKDDVAAGEIRCSHWL
ncbi:Hypothetical protein SMAX5B_013051 [Scophthalmus maximus]|uniref:Uncharacterized protein n=1 Tax=Scophthalmus maximus TaxID=52904 RepID=A0A2U9BEE7_SCOMX|nr:Hypothetical protein SMAX5B_013051 [Scophthalmus maximus]